MVKSFQVQMILIEEKGISYHNLSSLGSSISLLSIRANLIAIKTENHVKIFAYSLSDNLKRVYDLFVIEITVAASHEQNHDFLIFSKRELFVLSLGIKQIECLSLSFNSWELLFDDLSNQSGVLH